MRLSCRRCFAVTSLSAKCCLDDLVVRKVYLSSRVLCKAFSAGSPVYSSLQLCWLLQEMHRVSLQDQRRTHTHTLWPECRATLALGPKVQRRRLRNNERAFLLLVESSILPQFSSRLLVLSELVSRLACKVYLANRTAAQKHNQTVP